MNARRTKAGGLDPSEYRALAAFRHALRRFLSFSEEAARDVGLAPQQYQALLAIKAHPERDVMTINELAGQLVVRHNSAVGLVDRLEAEGLIARRPGMPDRRKVNLHLTSRGARVLERLASTHRAELRRIVPEFQHLLAHFAPPSGAEKRVSRHPGSVQAPRESARPGRGSAAVRASRRSGA